MRAFDGAVVALNPSDGSTRWNVALPSGDTSLLATDHALYAVSGANSLLALRPSDGARLWSASTNLRLADVGALLVQQDGRVIALNDLTGVTRWTSTPPAEDEFQAQLVFGSGVVLVVTSVRGGGVAQPTTASMR
jgi:outer membrane protein assembly factor BamB